MRKKDQENERSESEEKGEERRCRGLTRGCNSNKHWDGLKRRGDIRDRKIKERRYERKEREEKEGKRRCRSLGRGRNSMKA